MRSQLRNIVLNTIGSLKSIGTGVHILNSHYVSRNNLPAEIFSDLLKVLHKHADFIRIEDAIDLIEKKENTNQKLIAFTFDDGFKECYTKVAPVLKQFNTNAAFFINPGFINGNQKYKENFTKNIVHVNKEPMSWEMIRNLHNEGFIIGNHTMDHARLIQLSDEQYSFQISQSKKIIEEKINDKCEHFAWTYGTLMDIDSKALEIAIKEHKHVFSGDNYKKYYSLNQSVINRRHIEGDWPLNHVKYFLSHDKQF
jgi:peptidoglycan/xylan/chitin deacetylase (PgdA/CDA1 family)